MYAIDACTSFAARMTPTKESRSIKSKRKDALVLSVLEKVATILLRLGLDAPRSEYLLRSAFILAARKLAEARGVQSTQSQIALVAGVNRLDVRKLVGSRLDPRIASELDHQSRVERILGGWRRDPRFSDTRGRPKPLSISGRTSEFAKLTSKYGRDVTARTLRDTLVRNNFATIKGNKIVLNEKSSLETATFADGASGLGFLSSQLAAFDFHSGRRIFESRYLSLPAKDSKSLKLLQRKAVAKIEAALGSLESVVLQSPSQNRGKRALGNRVFITTILSSETDVTERN